MKAFKKKQRVTRTESLNSVPMRNPEVEEVRLDSGDILLIYPIKVKPWAGVLLRKLGRSHENVHRKKIQLDALGTFVWKLLNEQRTVNHIVQIFTREQQVHRKEAEIAVTQFLRELGKRNLIGIKQWHHRTP